MGNSGYAGNANSGGGITDTPTNNGNTNLNNTGAHGTGAMATTLTNTATTQQTPPATTPTQHTTTPHHSHNVANGANNANSFINTNTPTSSSYKHQRQHHQQ